MAVGTASNTLVDVEFGCLQGAMPEESEIRRWVQAALAAAGVSAPSYVSVKIVDAEEMRTLNRQFLGQNKPTNVLSFGSGPIEGLPAGEANLLGDIAICAPVVRDEARQQGKVPAVHWAHIIVHGTLHLLGFDHVSDSGAQEMEELEVQILASEGIADPYVA